MFRLPQMGINQVIFCLKFTTLISHKTNEVYNN